MKTKKKQSGNRKKTMKTTTVKAREITMFDDMAFSAIGAANGIFDNDCGEIEFTIHYTDKRALDALLTHNYKIVSYPGNNLFSNVIEIQIDHDHITRVTRLFKEGSNELQCEIFELSDYSGLNQYQSSKDLAPYYKLITKEFQSSLDNEYISKEEFNGLLFEFIDTIDIVLSNNEGLNVDNMIIITPENIQRIFSEYSESLRDCIMSDKSKVKVIFNIDKLCMPVAENGSCFLDNNGCFYIEKELDSPEGASIEYFNVQALNYDEYKDIEFKAIIK